MFTTKFQISEVSYLASSVKVLHPGITDEELKSAIASAQTVLDDTLDKYDIAISRQACLTGVTLVFDVVIPAIISTLPAAVQTVLNLVIPILKAACTAFCNTLPSATVQAQNGFLQGPLATTYLPSAVSGNAASVANPANAITGSLFLCVTGTIMCAAQAPVANPANAITGSLFLCVTGTIMCAAEAAAPANAIPGSLLLCVTGTLICGNAPQVDTIIPPKTFFKCE